MNMIKYSFVEDYFKLCHTIFDLRCSGNWEKGGVAQMCERTEPMEGKRDPSEGPSNKHRSTQQKEQVTGTEGKKLI